MGPIWWFLTFDDFKRWQELPNRILFRYLQLYHAFKAQFPHPIILEVHDVERLQKSPVGDKPFSALYSILASLDTSKVSQLFLVWQNDIPRQADDDWEEGLQQYLPLMISAQLKFLHQNYTSLVHRARIYPTREAVCPKCSSDTFFHVVWSCPQLQDF